jgi:hypothetical protein
MLNIGTKIREVRTKAQAYFRDHRFRRALREVAALPPGELPSRSVMWQLWSGWGNQRYSGHPEYLDEVVRRSATTSGPVLECGSGLSTLLLGIFAARRGIQVWTLDIGA